MRTLPLYLLTIGAIFFVCFPCTAAFANDGQASAGYSVSIRFTADTPLFPDDYLKPPISARATLLDPVRDSAEIGRAERFLREELAKYPSVLLKQDLHDIFVVKNLSYYDTRVGGFGSPGDKRLYILDDSNSNVATENYIRHTLHHEFAHLLVANHASHFSRSQWQHLNPSTFHYGDGGLEIIRAGAESMETFDPASWEQGFAQPYGKASPEEDFACLCEAMFSGDARFWSAVGRYDVLQKKVKMIVAFYHSLNRAFTDSYFRHLLPAQSVSTASVTHYNPGDLMLFPNGGEIVFLENPPRIITLRPGSSYIYPGPKVAVIFYPPGKPAQ